MYVADPQAFAIIVHDAAQMTSWKIVDKTFYPYPNFGTFNILGDSFELMDGVLGMALEPYVPGRDRKLFYHSLSSATENWVYTSFLQNRTRFTDNPNSSPEIFNVSAYILYIYNFCIFHQYKHFRSHVQSIILHILYLLYFNLP